MQALKLLLRRHDYRIAGSEIAGEAAAGLAAAYIALKANSGASSAQLASYLTHAKQLYSFANSTQGSYQDLTSECLAQHGVRSVNSGAKDCIF